jgi:hypothetical protein
VIVRRQDGAALPIAVISLMLILGLAGMVLTQSMRTGASADREQRSKRALQAADAGLQVAAFRTDKLATGLNPCPDAAGSGASSYVTIAGEQWCPSVAEDLGDSKSYSYRVSAPDANGNRRAVATGTAEGVTRRVAVVFEEVDVPLFDGFGVSSDLSITTDSSAQIGRRSPQIRTDARANGNITLNGSSNICGNATPGPGMAVVDNSSNGVCPGYITTPASAPIVFPPVDDSVAQTTNDNNRICKPALDPCSPLSSASPNVWDNADRNLVLNGSGTLTLRGSVYYLCSLQMRSSTRLILDPPDTSKPMLIYIGDCATQPTQVILMESSTQVVSAPGKTVPVQFLVKGSSSKSTTVRWESSSAAITPTAVYAPKSDIEMDSSSRILGAVTGKTVTMKSSSEILYDPRIDISPFDLSINQTATYRECRAQAADGAVPDEGC